LRSFVEAHLAGDVVAGEATVSKRALRRKALQRDSKVNSPELSMFLSNKCRSVLERDNVRKKLQFWHEGSVVPASVVGVSTPSASSSSSVSASTSVVAPPAQEEEQHEDEQEDKFQGSIVIVGAALTRVAWSAAAPFLTPWSPAIRRSMAARWMRATLMPVLVLVRAGGDAASNFINSGIS
jgi:hypothetical protein